MKSTGITRKVDGIGRIVIPREAMRNLAINKGDSLEFFIEDNALYLKKYCPGCVFCGSMDNLTSFKNVQVCKECMDDLKSKHFSNFK